MHKSNFVYQRFISKVFKTGRGTGFTPMRLRLHTAIVKILIAPINPCFTPVSQQQIE
jgi:hypothetical protein